MILYDNSFKEMNPDNAFANLKMSSDLGCTNATAFLGICYFEKNKIQRKYYGSEENRIKIARKLLEIAREKKNYLALAYSHLFGIDVRKDLGLVKYYASNANDNVIRFWILGEYFYRNQSPKAIEKFEEAAKGGCALAKQKLGDCYYHKNNLRLAKKYYKEAAEGGNSLAMYYLALFYDKIECLQRRNKEEARRWYAEGVKYGNAGSMTNLGKMYKEDYKYKGDEEDLSKAVELFQQAYSAGDQFASFQLGLCYEFGQGVVTNLFLAKLKYEESIANEIEVEGSRAGIGRIEDIIKTARKYHIDLETFIYINFVDLEDFKDGLFSLFSK